MAKAIITLEDTDDGQVNVHLNFGDQCVVETSGAHHMAVDVLTYITELVTEPQL